MALDLTGSTNSPNTPNIKTLIGKNYDLKLTQSIQNLLSEIPKQSPKCSDFTEEFYELMQARVDPPLESTWVYAALAFRSRNHPKDDPLDRVSAAEDLFQLLSMCSASCGSSKSVAMLAPVVRQVYNVCVDLFKRDLSLKREKKVMRKVRDFVGTILGYINLSSFEDSGESDSLITPFSGLIRVWMNSNEGLESFLPLVSSDMFGGLSEGECDVNYLAGVVIAEVFLLKLCLDFKVGTSGKELEKELSTWAIGSITTFGNCYLYDVLLRMLLDKTLPITSLLNSEGEVLLRKVLYDAIVLVEYSFLNPDPERAIYVPAELMKSIAMERLIVAHEAVEYFRENGDQRRAISYVTAFSGSQLPSQIIKWVKKQIYVDDGAIKSVGTSPRALIKWLLNLEDQGLKLFDDSIAKFRTKLALDISKSDSLRPASNLEEQKVDDDLLFYIDNKGEDEHRDEEDEKVNESIAATHTMSSSEKRGRKRKGKKAEKKEKIKFVKYDLRPNADSAGGRPSLINNDSINSRSEAENPLSDEDTD
ncbi:unnamed protein product [Malus baccata var. baccata]